MSDFHLSVAHEVIHPKPFNNNLNKFTLKRIAQNENVEIKTFVMKDKFLGACAAAKINPIQKLFNKGILSQKESWAAEDYQTQFAISNKSNYAKPSSIYNGLASSKIMTEQENIPNQDFTDARAFIFKVRMELQLHNQETQYRNKTFQIVDLQLDEILKRIFNKEQKTDYVEQVLHIGRSTLEQRIKKICEILLDLKKTKN